MTKIIIKKNYLQLSRTAGRIIKDAILKKPNLVLGLATGSTPLGMYQELIRLHQKEKLDFSQVTAFNLDEYLGLPNTHPQSYHYYMWQNFFKQINIKPENVFIPAGEVKNIKSYCSWYEGKIKERGGIDLQILGIGRNGHIGFNEPGTSFSSTTHLVSLDQKTIQDNSRFFKKITDVPRQAITMGIQTILQARKCLVLANGEHKKEIIYQALKGPLTPQIPASSLQKHQNLIVLLDKKAGERLKGLSFF